MMMRVLLALLLLVGTANAARYDSGAYEIPGTLTINIANAPGWTSGTSHALKDRIVAGAGWNGTAFTNGQPVCLYGLSAGSGGNSGTDATVFNASCASGVAAAVGGGLDGTVPSTWSGAASVTDGALTWKLLQRIDYVTITGFNCDDSRSWATSTSYALTDHVLNAGHCYVMDNTFAGSNPCTSASSGPGPTGTTFNSAITDNTCRWYYKGELTYSSQLNRLPHQLYNPATLHYQEQFTVNPQVYLWYGGAQRTKYQPGVNGELAPMEIQHHSDLIGDREIDCMNNATTQIFDCVGAGIPYYITISVPAGDALADNVTPATGPLNWDDTKGVIIYNNAAVGANGAGDGLDLGDSIVKLIGLQIVSVNGVALPTTPASYLFGPTNTNAIWLQRSLVQSGPSGNAGLTCDNLWNIDNSLIISQSTTAGSAVVHCKYQMAIHDSTLVCTSGAATNSTGLQQIHFIGSNTAPPMNNNLILGCAKPYAFGDTFSSSGANNATDVVGTPTGSFTDPIFGGTVTAAAFPGTTLTGLTASAQLKNSTPGASFDGRIKDTSAAIYGAAAAFSFTQGGSLSMAWMSPITPGVDILGTTRPIPGGRYDIGSEMFIPGSAPPVTAFAGRGRVMMHR